MRRFGFALALALVLALPSIAQAADGKGFFVRGGLGYGFMQSSQSSSAIGADSAGGGNSRSGSGFSLELALGYSLDSLNDLLLTGRAWTGSSNGIGVDFGEHSGGSMGLFLAGVAGQHYFGRRVGAGHVAVGAGLALYGDPGSGHGNPKGPGVLFSGGLDFSQHTSVELSTSWARTTGQRVIYYPDRAVTSDYRVNALGASILLVAHSP